MRLNIIVTAGPTIEPIDPVRYISNFSTGNMGYAIAGEARRRGHKVTLISGPVNIPAPKNVQPIRIRSSNDLLKQLNKKFGSSDAVIMAAAVCDFQANPESKNKIRRQNNFNLSLKKAPDVLKKISQRKKKKVLVGFALESKNVLGNALKKLQQKNLDLIVANKLNGKHQPFGKGKTTVWFCERENRVKKFEHVPKPKVARHLLDRVEELCYFRRLSH